MNVLKIIRVFQDFYFGQYIPVWYTPVNHEQDIFIVYNSDDKDRTKQFSTTIKIS